jgi:hypothetical protein
MPEFGDLAWWLGLNVALPLAPILLVRFAAWLVNMNRRLLTILRDGQLCFFSSALAAVAVHDVLTRSPRTSPTVDIAVAVVLLMAVIAFAMFVYGIAVIRAEEASPDHRVAWTSIWTVVVTISIVVGTRWSFGLLG